MRAQGRLAAIATGVTVALLFGGSVMASPTTKAELAAQANGEPESKEAVEARIKAEKGCQDLPTMPGPIPESFAARCITAPKGEPTSSLQPNVSRGPILLQEVSTNTVDFSSVAGIATLTSFGALVPVSGTDFPADFIRLPGDSQRVYQITSAGAVSRYTAGGVNTVLTPIPAAAGSTWSDTATDPTSGNVYGSAIVGSCVSSTLSRINVIAGTRVDVGPITGGGCIISLAADNAGNLFGIDIVGDNLISINKVTGAGTVVGPIGFNSNFGQALDCDPASGICYMFTINVTTANSADLRSVNTLTGATALVGNYGSTSPGGAVQVGGAVFETIADSCAIDADCQDGNLCNGVETCVATVCNPGTAVVCNDGLFCTTDTCNPATGVCSFPANPCGDGDACTTDSCNEANDTCTHVNTSQQFCNTGVITIPSSGAGTPYPSTIVVAGLGTSAALCSVQLKGITHTWPGDIDVLLQGPVATTQNATIMSDVATGNFPVTNVSLTLSDSAATSLPGGGPLVTGTFKPTNVGATADAFPAPAPAANVSSALTVFAGNPNGTWRLYVVDDFTGDSGTMGQGWCLNIVSTGCNTSADCSDGNPCTDDTCSNSVCVFTNNTAACTDGNACTLNDLCSGGVCVGGSPQICEDNDACTANNCNTGTGACQFPAIVCNDNNTCTDDSCNSASGCVYTANDANACSDGNLCTVPDVCQGGTCVGQNPVVCAPDANICTTEQCNPATGLCISVNNTVPCDDGNVCTSGDKCGPALSENFDAETTPNIPGTWTTSATGTGQPWTTVSTSSDTPPNSAFGFDGPTVSDELLISPPIAIATASAQLTFRNRWSFENTTTTCYDAGVLEIDIAGGGFTDIVTAGGSFVSGGYTGTVNTGFTNPLAGRSAWCVTSAGYPGYLTTVVNLPAAAAGQTIQLQWRIGTDTSAIGPGQNIDSIVVLDGGTNTCMPGSDVTDCNDFNPCTDDYCDLALGCQHANNTDNCDDANACTILDKCSAGACGGTAVICDDSQPCTLDSCDSGSGCVFTPIAPPGEVQNVTASPDKVTYSWAATPSATNYDVVRGNVGALPVGPGGGDEVCFGSIAVTSVTDGSVPPSGIAYWYLSRGNNNSCKGTYGTQGVNGAPGAPRNTTTCP